MLEEILVTARANPKVDPLMGVWSWEVPVYLFLGGLTAGIMFFSAVMILSRKQDATSFVTWKYPLWAPIVLSVGMGALFLDLEHKLYVWRFYTTFEPTSPMSWGSWILLFIYAIATLQILSTFRVGYPGLARYVDRFEVGRFFLDLGEIYRRGIAKWSIPFAVALGIYTGILLSAFSARPFWNTGILGPLFLVSGLSTAAALAILGTRNKEERHLFARIDLGLILAEMALVALLLVNLSTGARAQLDAASLVLGGEYTLAFWLLFVTPGLLIPLLLEYIEIKGARGRILLLGPLLVLFGGYMLRHITVELGQVSTWTHYATQYDPALLQLLK